MKDFTQYEQSLELKELGFDEPCFGYYDIKDNNLQLFSDNLQDASCNSDLKYDDFKHCTAPLYQQAFRFFRENHDLRIWIESNYGVLKFEYVIATTNPNFINKQFNDFSGYNTYEEAELACLIKLIEIVKTK